VKNIISLRVQLNNEAVINTLMLIKETSNWLWLFSPSSKPNLLAEKEAVSELCQRRKTTNFDII
jgi:hypothetical protein